jgi:pimeloyl-ACP methyl ester carboxylesterase/alkylhydroperoxidase/carboxymuconolactone decarboxylase family protein YurZ
MSDSRQKIPSERLGDANADVAANFRAMRLAIEKAGPLDYATREYLMLAAFAAAGYEESFRVHAERAVKRGLSKAAMQQAVLVPLGAATAMLPVVRALEWIDDAFARQGGEPAILTLAASDGVTIGHSRTGDGPPLVLVHGTSSERGRWNPVVPQLEQRYTVHAMDRRGRGASTDAAAYRIELEFTDVTAIVDSFGAPVDVVAHSYGAICALEATRITSNIRRLVLYEPPIATQSPSADAAALEATIDEVARHLEANDPASALAAFYSRNLGMPEAEIAALRKLPNWPARLALAHTLPRELREARRYRFDAARFRDYSVPTLLVLGGDSASRHKDATGLLHASLAGSKLAVLAGHKHGAIDAAPQLFAATVVDFLNRA